MSLLPCGAAAALPGRRTRVSAIAARMSVMGECWTDDLAERLPDIEQGPPTAESADPGALTAGARRVWLTLTASVSQTEVDELCDAYRLAAPEARTGGGLAPLSTARAPAACRRWPTTGTVFHGAAGSVRGAPVQHRPTSTWAPHPSVAPSGATTSPAAGRAPRYSAPGGRPVAGSVPLFIAGGLRPPVRAPQGLSGTGSL